MGKRASTIKRAPHDKDNPYKMIRQATLEDSRLSWEARGMIGYLLMKPDNWTITVPNLMREGGCGRDKTYRIVAELVEFGYLERVDVREEGKFSETTYHVHESPCPEKPYTAEPHTEKPLTANPQHSNNTYSTKNEESTKDEEGEGAPSPSPPVELPSRNGTNGKLHYRSPHIDKTHFDPTTGYVRPGHGATAVEVYYERFDIQANDQRLTEPMEDDLVGNCPDLELLREVVTAYSQAGFKKQRNIKLILDWYKEPARFRNNHQATRASPNGHNLRGAEKNMSIMDQFEAQFGDMEIEL